MVAGSGIGLFVCASLAAAMGGRIWARRRPTGGSEFGFIDAHAALGRGQRPHPWDRSAQPHGLTLSRR